MLDNYPTSMRTGISKSVMLFIGRAYQPHLLNQTVIRSNVHVLEA